MHIHKKQVLSSKKGDAGVKVGKQCGKGVKQSAKGDETIAYIDLSFRGRENTGDYFRSLRIDRGATDVNLAREIIKPVFSRPREIRVLSQEG